MQIAIFNQHFWITIRVRVIRDIRDIRVRVRVTVRVRVRARVEIRVRVRVTS